MFRLYGTILVIIAEFKYRALLSLKEAYQLYINYKDEDLDDEDFINETLISVANELYDEIYNDMKLSYQVRYTD